MNSKRIFAACLVFLLVSCAQSEVKSQSPSPNAPPPEAQVPVYAAPGATESSKIVTVAQPAAVPTEEVWKVVKGKIGGAWPKALLISRFKNKKLPGYTSDICYNFGKFAIVETKSTGEMGSAEIVLRYEPRCIQEYKGKYANLRIIEGHLAGVAGDYVVVDGDDRSEGVIEFQLFALEDGREVYKGRRNSSEEFTITRKDGVTSVVFYTKMKAICELAVEGEACWKKVIEQNGAPKHLPLPDCKKAYEKAKVEFHEPALVTGRARIKDMKSPSVEWIAGKPTCEPEPN